MHSMSSLPRVLCLASSEGQFHKAISDSLGEAGTFQYHPQASLCTVYPNSTYLTAVSVIDVHPNYMLLESREIERINE